MESKINKYIFREYDIRGKVKSELEDIVVLNIGKAFGTIVINRDFNTICVSGDVRESSIDIKRPDVVIFDTDNTLYEYEIANKMADVNFSYSISLLKEAEDVAKRKGIRM